MFFTFFYGKNNISCKYLHNQVPGKKIPLNPRPILSSIGLSVFIYYRLISWFKVVFKMAWFRKKENTHAYLGLIPAKRVKVNRLHRLANWLDNWHFTRVTASLSSLALILTLPMLWIDLFDRYEQRNNQAWQLVTAKATGNSGKRQALEYLNKSIFFFKEKSPLVGINLSDV